MLKVKQSQLPGSGKGLFTTTPIKKGETVIEYLGEMVTWKVCEERALEDKDGYVLFIDKNHCIDAWATKDALARYANDATGLSKVKGLKNNCRYETRGYRGYIVALQDIPAGGEIFVSYGKEYWDVIRYNLKLKAKKK